MTYFLSRHASGRTLTAIAMEEHYAYSTVRNTMDEARLRLESSTMVPIRTLAHACMVAMSLGYLTQPTGADLTVFPAT